MKYALPFGTFLAIGAAVSAAAGQTILDGISGCGTIPAGQEGREVSACGHAERRSGKAGARHRRKFALGRWGPSASEKKMSSCKSLPPRTR